MPSSSARLRRAPPSAPRARSPGDKRPRLYCDDIMALGPRCKICGKPYVFPDCELEVLMYPRAGTKGPWERSAGEDDRAKFRNWTLAQVEQATAEGRQPGELGLNLILLGDKEGLRLLAPLLTGTVQQKWDFIVKRLVPFSFSLTHAR